MLFARLTASSSAPASFAARTRVSARSSFPTRCAVAGSTNSDRPKLDFSENLVESFPLHKREVANTAQLNAQRFSNKRADPVERFLGT